MIRYGILILCVSGCFARLSNSAGSLRPFPEPKPRNQGNQVPFEPIYIPIAETPVSQSIEPFIGPLFSQQRQNGRQNLFQLPNGPNVPFPGRSPGIGHGMHSRSVTQTSEVPVIGFDDFMALIRQSTVSQSGTGQDVTYVNLGTLIPRAPIVAIPSNTLPSSLRGNSGTVVSQQTRVSGGQGPLQISSLTQGRSGGLLSSALANINRVPQIPLHPIAALHHALSGGSIPHPGLTQQGASFGIPSIEGRINSGLNHLHHAATAARQVAANTDPRTMNAVHRSLSSSGQLPGPIHPTLLRSLSNTASIPSVPLHPVSVMNTAATRGISSIPRVPVSGILSNQGNGGPGVAGGQSRFVTTSNIASGQFNTLSTGFNNLPLVSRPTILASPHSNVQPDFRQRAEQRTSSISSFTSRPNNPLTVNRFTIPGPLNADRINRFPQIFGLDPSPASETSSATNDFVRRTGFDDFLPRDSLRSVNLPGSRGFSEFNGITPRSPLSMLTRRSDDLHQPSNFPRTSRFDNIGPGAFQSIPRSRSDIFIQPPRSSRFDESRPIPTRPRDSTLERLPSDRPRAQFPSDNRADFTRNLDPLLLSRDSNLPSPLDERIQENFIRDNFALPRQFDPISRNFDPATLGRAPRIVRPSAIALPPIPRSDTRNQQNQASFPSIFQFNGPDFNVIRENRFADPWNNRFSPGDSFIERRDGRFDESLDNRFGPENRFFDQRDNRRDNLWDNRFSPDRFDERLDDRRDRMFGDRRDEFFDDQFDGRDGNSFTPFFQSRFSPLVRPSGSRFSISPVSRELTRAFQRSQSRRPRGSFMISFLVNIDDVSDAADGVGIDINRGIPPGFQNRFIPRDASLPFSVRGPMGEDINQLEEIDPFKNQRRFDTSDSEERFNMRDPQVMFNGRRGFAFGEIDNSPIGPFDGRDNRPMGPFDGRDNRPIGPFDGRDNRPFDGSNIDPIGSFESRNNRPIGSFGRRDTGPVGPFGGRDNGPIGPFGRRDNGPIGPFDGRDIGPIGPFDGRDNGPIRPFDGRDNGPIGPFSRRDNGPIGPFEGRDNGPIGPFDGRDIGPIGPFSGRDNGPTGPFDGRDNGPIGPFDRRDNGPIGPFDGRGNGLIEPLNGIDNGPMGRFDGRDNGPIGPFSGSNFLSRVPFIPPMAPSPVSRILPPITSPVVSRSFLSQPDQFTNRDTEFRQISSRLDPISESVRPIRENPRPFAIAIPDPDGRRNQPFLTAAIEGQFDGPATEIDFNSAFNRRQPSLTSEPVDPFSDRRTNINLPAGRFSTSDISSRPAASNFQHLLNLGNSIVHSQTSQSILGLGNELNLRRPTLASQSLAPIGGLSSRPAVTNAQHLLNIGNSIVRSQISPNIPAFANTIGSQRQPLFTSRQPVNTVLGRMPFASHSSFSNSLHVKHATHFGRNFRQVPRSVSGLLNSSLQSHQNIRHLLPLGRHTAHIGRAGGPTIHYPGLFYGSQKAYGPFK